jgi:putative sterol carrier protein
MADALPLYWSAAYLDVFVDALRADPDFQRAARKFDGVVILRCLDTPEGEDVEAAYHLSNGSVRVERLAEKAPSASFRSKPFDGGRAFARTTAPYRLWTKLDRGEMNVLQAIASPDYHVEGSKLRIMANIGLFNAMAAVGARTPKRFA